MLSLREMTVICDAAENESTSALSAAVKTPSLRYRMDDTEALKDSCTPSQDPVSLTEDRSAISEGDRHSSESFAEAEGRQDCNVNSKDDDAKVDKLSNSADDSRVSIPETPKGYLRPQSRRLLGITVVPMEAGQERFAGAKPKRKPTTKRRRSTRGHHAVPLQSAATDTMKTTVNFPNLPSRPPPAVPIVAKEKTPSVTETQVTGACVTSQSLDSFSKKKAALYADIEPPNPVSDIDDVPRSCSIEKRTSARRHKAHSKPGDPALGFPQSAVGKIKNRGTRSPRKQRNKQGTPQQNKAKDRQCKNTCANGDLSRTNPVVAGIHENVQDPNALHLAKTQIGSTPESDRKAGLRKSSVPENPNNQAYSIFGTEVRDSMQRRPKRQKRVNGSSEQEGDVNKSEEVLARSLNTSPSCPSSSTITHKNNPYHPDYSPTITTDSTDICAPATYIQHPGTMSNAGSTRGHGCSHRGKDRRRSSNNQTLSDSIESLFQSQRTPSVGSSRRRRGFQPDEVNKNKEKSKREDTLTTQCDGIAENLTAMKNHPEESARTKKLASTMTPKSTGPPLAPHRRTQVKDKNSNHQPSIHTQVAMIDASHPEFDPVYVSNVSKPIESETSSIQIITERKPSCWSIASPPEDPPTEWNSASANIDRPALTKLPIYRIPKLEHKKEHENISTSLNRQQAKVNPQATASTSKAKKLREMDGSPRVAAPEKDEVQATARSAPQIDGHTADPVHQIQQLRRDVRLDAQQASQLKAIEEQLLAGTMQVSSGIQLESDELKSWSPTEDASHAKLLDVKGTRLASSATSLQAKSNQVSNQPEKRSGAAPPHLRVQSACPKPDNKDKPLPPHLRDSTIPSTATVTGKHMTPAIRDTKLPPHLQGLSTAETRATKGLLLATTPSPTPQNNNACSRPTIDMDEETAATRPILDIDEEIVAGLRAETSGAVLLAQPTDRNAQETKTNEQTNYVPPHIRAPSQRLKEFTAESKSEVTEKDAKPPADQHSDRNHNTNTRSNSLTVEPYAGALHDVTNKRKNTNLTFSSKNGAVLNGAESSVKKGKKPAREFESIDYTSELVDWDGKINPPPVGDEWDRRRPFDPRSHERLAVIEAWREEHAADPEEHNRVIVDTASAEFQTGEGLAGGDTNVLSPIDKREHDTRISNDDFTQARRHQNAAEAMKDYEVKIAAKPKLVPSGIEGMTKEEKRALRRALIEEERTRVILPNPHAPAANIYLRPAEFKDMGQVMNIYNDYVQKTSFVIHLNPVDELYWRSRLQEAEDEKNPFVVAIHMGEKSCRRQEDIIRRKQENIVGFAVAADFGSKNTLYHSSVELELMVHPDFHRQGIGRTLLDRILAALSPDHNLLECAPFLPLNDICHWVGGGSRQAKAIMVNILHSDGKEDTINWCKQWLAKYEFQHVGTLPQVGFKKGKLLNLCQLVLTTSVRL